MSTLPTKPAPLYPCHFCNEEYSWPASDLHWSNRFSDWVCGECWCGNCHHDDDYEPDEMGVRLSDYLHDITEKELATLRAKAKAYDEGREQWQIWDPCHSKLEMIGQTESEAITAFRQSIPSNNPPEPWSQYLAAGYTCSKVRVCKEVDE